MPYDHKSDEPRYAWEGKGLDEVSARELHLFIDNDADLYTRQRTPIFKNLVLKKLKGKYDHAKAAILFGYLVEAGAKKYTKEYGGPGASWSGMFPPKLRKAVAEELRDQFETEYALGNYNNESFLPKFAIKAKAKAAKPKVKRKSVSRSLGGMR